MPIIHESHRLIGTRCRDEFLIHYAGHGRIRPRDYFSTAYTYYISWRVFWLLIDRLRVANALPIRLDILRRPATARAFHHFLSTNF